MPISDNLASDGTFRPEKRRFYESVIDSFASLGLKVESAALNENWGKIKLPPVKFTAYDIEAIERSDILAVVTSERLTRDMYLEVGWALALRQPVLFFIAASTNVTFMIEGLRELDRVTVVRYDAEADVPQLVKDALRPFVTPNKQ